MPEEKFLVRVPEFQRQACSVAQMGEAVRGERPDLESRRILVFVAVCFSVA
jgi:hypothetical protein